MALEDLIERVLTLDQLLKEGQTGNIDELSEKLKLSKRQTFKYLRAMANTGRNNAFDRELQSYIYLKEQ